MLIRNQQGEPFNVRPASRRYLGDTEMMALFDLCRRELYYGDIFAESGTRQFLMIVVCAHSTDLKKMAPFKRSRAGWSRLDYQLLQNGGVCLYFSNDVLRKDLAWLRARGYVIHEFNASLWKTKADFHKSVAETLRFPSYYGRNLDAFVDCLRDLKVPQKRGGMAIVIREVDSFRTVDKKFCFDVLDVLADTIRDNLVFGRRFLVLLQTRNPDFEHQAVGAVPVMWNPKEWLESRRGL